MDYKYGQWVGSVHPDNGFEVRSMLNIEARNPTRAQVLNHSRQFTDIRTIARFDFDPAATEMVVEHPNVRFYDVNNGNLILAEEFWKAHAIKEPLPKRTTYKFSEKGRELAGSYETDTGQKGTFRLKNTTNDPTREADFTFDWNQFKQFVAENYLNNERIVFRGQGNNRFKLRTLFHRCKRNDLHSYLDVDVPLLCHSVNATSTFYYRMEDGEHLGALLSLAQHHGYPTPLLDWTHSPYIAAFFAFTEPSQTSAPPAAVRIFVFDVDQWPVSQSAKLIFDPMPHVSFHRFSAHNNPRFTPQQSIASFSNVDDMEGFIALRAAELQTNPLTIIDIPITSRQTAIDELRLMGITAGSLFPGLDGTCRSLRERFF